MQHIFFFLFHLSFFNQFKNEEKKHKRIIVCPLSALTLLLFWEIQNYLIFSILFWFIHLKTESRIHTKTHTQNQTKIQRIFISHLFLLAIGFVWLLYKENIIPRNNEVSRFSIIEFMRKKKKNDASVRYIFLKNVRPYGRAAKRKNFLFWVFPLNLVRNVLPLFHSAASPFRTTTKNASECIRIRATLGAQRRFQFYVYVYI